MLPATAILLLATYLQYTIGMARSESYPDKGFIYGALPKTKRPIMFRGAYNDRIKSELKRVAEEKRRLTAEFDRAMGRVASTVL